MSLQHPHLETGQRLAFIVIRTNWVSSFVTHTFVRAMNLAGFLVQTRSEVVTKPPQLAFLTTKPAAVNALELAALDHDGYDMYSVYFIRMTSVTS